MAHANKGDLVGLSEGWMNVSERHFRVRWAGASWRGEQFWTWQPQSELIVDVPEIVGAYCAAKNLVLPPEHRAHVAAAMTAEEAAIEAEAAEEEEEEAAARVRRPASQTPIPRNVDVEELLDVFTSPIGTETANGEIRRVQLSAAATAAQRRMHEAMFVTNAEGEREHKQTLMAREQYEKEDDKAAPGRQRYRHGSRMAIISEDDHAKDGFWSGEVYQVHSSADATRKMHTRAGPLPLAGMLEVGYMRIAEIRRSMGPGGVAHPRLSVRRDDVGKCEVVMVPLVEDSAGVLREDRSKPPQLLPLTLLGCKVEVRIHYTGSAYQSGQYTVVRHVTSCGGVRLRMLELTEATFAASAMEAGGNVQLEEMKVPQLKEELAARAAARSGVKAALQRRLHGLLIEAAIRRDAEAAADEGADAVDTDEHEDATFWAAVEAAAEVEQARTKARTSARGTLLHELFGTDSDEPMSDY